MFISKKKHEEEVNTLTKEIKALERLMQNIDKNNEALAKQYRNEADGKIALQNAYGDMADRTAHLEKVVTQQQDVLDAVEDKLKFVLEQRTSKPNATAKRMLDATQEALALVNGDALPEEPMAQFIEDEPKPEGTLKQIADGLRDQSGPPASFYPQNGLEGEPYTATFSQDK